MLRGQRAENRELGRCNKRETEWLKTLKWVSSSLTGIEHVFVKLLVDPPLFSDIDIMIPDEDEREKALEALGGRERFHTGALLEGPGRFILKLENLDLDIYPNACWGGFKVADGREIVARGITGKPFGIELKLPAPDDDFYLTATHAFSHLNVRRVELENCKSLSTNPLFDICRVKKLATRYGTEPIIAIFCEILNIDVGLEHDDYINKWLSKTSKDIGVNNEIPKSFILESFLNHIRSLSGKASLRELTTDIAWHLIRPLTKLVKVR